MHHREQYLSQGLASDTPLKAGPVPQQLKRQQQAWDLWKASTALRWQRDDAEAGGAAGGATGGLRDSSTPLIREKETQS